ncbi:MAG: hypothetical protein AAFY69_15840 [Pseudomonadota bacterium]
MTDNVPSIMLIDTDLLDLEKFDDLEEPTSSSLEFPLLDDDVGECRLTHASELRDLYIDNGIVRIMPPKVNMSPLAFDVAELERQESMIHYSDGAQLLLPLDRILLTPGQPPRRFLKHGGIIYPIDINGHLVLNASTVPFLAAVRSQFQRDMEERSDQLIEMAELVNAFAGIISLNSNVAEAF